MTIEKLTKKGSTEPTSVVITGKGLSSNPDFQTLYENKTVWYFKGKYYAKIADYDLIVRTLDKTPTQSNQLLTDFKKASQVFIDKTSLDEDQLEIVSFFEKQVNLYLAGLISKIDLPSFVITAGPGSGKTYTMGRLLEILLKADPTIRILATTFTNAAVEATMKNVSMLKGVYLNNLDIFTVSKIGHDSIKGHYTGWYSDLSSDTDFSLNQALSGMAYKSNAQRQNEFKTYAIMKDEGTHTFRQFFRYRMSNQDYSEIDAILNSIDPSSEVTIERSASLAGFIFNEEPTTKSRQLDIIRLACTKTSVFQSAPLKVLPKQYTYFKKLLSLAKNHLLMYDDKAELLKIATLHTIELSSEDADYVLRLLSLSDNYHKVDRLFKNGNTGKKYLFDMDDFARIPYLEQLFPTTYDYFLFDETQDFTMSQFKYLESWAALTDAKIIAVGDFKQAIYYYNATQLGKALKILTEKYTTFGLNFNRRSSEAVVQDAIKRSGLNYPVKMPASVIQGEACEKSFEYLLANITGEDFVTARYNASIFDVALILILNKKQIFLKGDSFDSIMSPLYNPISEMVRKGKPITVTALFNHFDEQIEKIKSILEFYNPTASADELIANNKPINDILSTRATVKQLLKNFGYIKEGEDEPKRRNIAEFLNDLKKYFVDERTPSSITVLNFHQTKGLECRNNYIFNIDDCFANKLEQSDEQNIADQNLVFVACSRAKVANYHIKYNFK